MKKKKMKMKKSNIIYNKFISNSKVLDFKKMSNEELMDLICAPLQQTSDDEVTLYFKQVKDKVYFLREIIDYD